MTRRTRFIFTALITMSLGFQVFMAFFQSGMRLTPFGSYDASGALYTFLEPVTAGHLALMLSRGSWAGAMHCLGPIGAACIGFHVIGAVLLWCSDAWRGLRMSFFAFQALLPTGWSGLIIWVAAAFDLVMDGEDLDEGIGQAMFAAGSWLVISLCILFADARARWVQRRSQMSLSSASASVSLPA